MSSAGGAEGVRVVRGWRCEYEWRELKEGMAKEKVPEAVVRVGEGGKAGERERWERREGRGVAEVESGRSRVGVVVAAGAA